MVAQTMELFPPPAAKLVAGEQRNAHVLNEPLPSESSLGLCTSEPNI